MRWLLLLLLVAASQAALLEDPAGDVQADHCQEQQTPVVGWEAMDLRELEINETPQHIIFSVTAEGLERSADYDAGNYFVYLSRGNTHYNMRMFQENSGTGAIAEVYLVETPTAIFGELLERFPADIVGNTISAAIDRDIFVDSDGAAPIRGHRMLNLTASAEAHATGFYGCSFDGSGGGPYIVRDLMPDNQQNGAEWIFRYGGGEANGPIDLTVERPYRASNGEATVYRFEVTVLNRDAAQHSYEFETIGLPAGWELIRPNGTLSLDAGQSSSFDVFLRVPFQHVHGTTLRFDLQAISLQEPTTQARAEMGVHYLETPQPAGHHDRVYLHARSGLGPDEVAGPLGEGAHEIYFNTLEDDENDQGIPVQAEVRRGPGGDYHWTGCLSPRLALGLSPGVNETGFELVLSSQIELSGSLTGYLKWVTDRHSDTCRGPGIGNGTEIARFEADVSGPNVSGTVTRTFTNDIPYEPGTDLYLFIEFQPEHPTAGAEAPSIVGGHFDLPLVDFHETANVPESPGTDTPFVEEAETAAKKSPAPFAVITLLAALALTRRSS